MGDSTQDQNPEYVHRAFASIARRYVVTNHVLSLGIDRLWRREVARIVRESGAHWILDVATGSGDLARAVEAGVPGSRVIGADFCQPMLAEAKRLGSGNLLVADGLKLPFADDRFDALTIGYGLRNMADWRAALLEFRRVLKPGGKLVILDFSLPRLRAMRAAYRFYLHRVLPLIAGWLTGNRDAYVYLGDSIERFPSGAAMVGLIDSCGFGEVAATPLCGGISSVYAAAKII